MLKFILGVTAGIAGTFTAARIYANYVESNTTFEKPTVINDKVLELRKQLLTKIMVTMPGQRYSADDIHEYYIKETARIDAIYTGQS